MRDESEHDMSTDLYQRVAELGYDHGRGVGSWVIDGNSTDDERAAIRRGYDDGDPQIMDMCPNPLSGEWSGDPTPRSVLAELGTDEDDDLADEYLMQYEQEFEHGFWDEVLTYA